MACLPLGFVAKILIAEGEEVPTATVRPVSLASPRAVCRRACRSLMPYPDCGWDLCSRVQPVMVVVEEEEDIAAFAVRFL